MYNLTNNETKININNVPEQTEETSTLIQPLYFDNKKEDIESPICSSTNVESDSQKAFINRISIDETYLEAKNAGHTTPDGLIIPVEIDKAYLAAKEAGIVNENGLIDPIIIDKGYLATKEVDAANKDCVINLTVTGESPHFDVFTKENTDLQENKISEVVNMSLISSPKSNVQYHPNVVDYLTRNNLPLEYVHMVTPNLQNSIGVAEKLIQYLPEFIYVPKIKKIFTWNQEFWKEKSIEIFKKEVIKMIKNYIFINKCNHHLTNFILKTGEASYINGLVDTLLSLRSIEMSKVNSVPNIICLKNGVFSFDTFDLYPFENYKYNFITSQIDYSYIPYATSDVLNYFLSSIMGDVENITFLQQIFGYALLGKPDLQLAFILLGSGSNGKSTLIAAIQHLLKDLTGVMPISYFTGNSTDDPNRPSPATYNIKDKHFIFTSEAETSSYLNESKIKKFIGGGKLKARPPYGQLVEFDNYATLFLDTNVLPHFKSGGFSMQRRLLVVPFPFTFSKENVDPFLLDKLKTEEAQTALLAWLIAGALMVKTNGRIITTKRVVDETNAYFMEEDTIKSFFEIAVVDDLNSVIPIKNIYETYQKYCKINHFDCKSMDTFAKSESIKKYPIKRGKVRCRKGLRIIETFDEI